MLRGKPVASTALRAPPRICLSVKVEGIGWGQEGQPLARPAEFTAFLCEICSRVLSLLRPEVLEETVKTLRNDVVIIPRRIGR